MLFDYQHVCKKQRQHRKTIRPKKNSFDYGRAIIIVYVALLIKRNGAKRIKQGADTRTADKSTKKH